MLKPVAMAKVAIVGPKSQMASTIDLLQDLRLLHIEDYVPGESGFELGSPLPEGAKVSERLLRVRGLLKSAQFGPVTVSQRFTPENLRALQEKLAEVETELSHMVEKRNGLVEAQKRLEEEAAALQRIQNFPLPIELLRGYRTITVVAGFLPKETNVDSLKTAHPSADLETSQESEGTFLVGFVANTAVKPFQDALTALHFQPIELTASQGNPAHRIAAIQEEQVQLVAQIAEFETKIAQVRDRYGPSFYALDEYLSIEADKSSVPVRFRTTRNSFMVEGWAPREDLARLKTSIHARTNGTVFVTELPTPFTTPWKTSPKAHGKAHHGEAAAEEPPRVEEPPVRLQHGKLASPYVLLTDTYSRPKYTEFDPTLFFYFGFPLFYGFMLGDIAYGILLLLMVWTGVFTRIFKFFGFQSHWHLNKVLTHSAYMSILFGVLYAEAFGVELFGEHGVFSHYHTHWGPIPFPLSRFENVKLLLFITLAIAAFHMLLGLYLGLRKAAKEHGWGHALGHRGSWMLILLAATLAGAAGLPPLLDLGTLIATPLPFYYVSLGLFVLGCILLVVGEGATALLELPTILSNLLSYTRLVAIGLSSAGIALAGNKVSELGFDAGGVAGIATAILILIFFHLLNLVLGIIGPALHSLRLHYVEFFTKFYEGGGEPYEPFGLPRRFTVKEVKKA